MSESQIDKAIADGRVPSDVSKAFLLESKDQPAIAGIIFVAALTFIIVCGRVLSRAFLVRRFGYDDALAVASMVCIPMSLRAAPKQSTPAANEHLS